MSSIPDTGSGLAGFLGHYLWQVYVHFPSQGRWDWVLLFLALGILVHFVFLPYLWLAVKADMGYLQSGKMEAPNQDMLPGLWALACLLFFVWFFHTPAGHTFLADRNLPRVGRLTKVNVWFLLASALLTIEFAVLMIFEDEITKLDKALGLSKPQAYRQRNWQNLYGGGGVFFRKDGVVAQTWGVVSDETAFFWLAHLLFPIWSVAALVLLHAFIVSAFLTDGCRMVFVYIQHKQTFG